MLANTWLQVIMPEIFQRMLLRQSILASYCFLWIIHWSRELRGRRNLTLSAYAEPSQVSWYWEASYRHIYIDSRMLIAWTKQCRDSMWVMWEIIPGRQSHYLFWHVHVSGCSKHIILRNLSFSYTVPEAKLYSRNEHSKFYLQNIIQPKSGVPDKFREP